MSVEYISVVNVQVAVDVGEWATLNPHPRCHRRPIRLEKSLYQRFRNVEVARHTEVVVSGLMIPWRNRDGDELEGGWSISGQRTFSTFFASGSYKSNDGGCYEEANSIEFRRDTGWGRATCSTASIQLMDMAPPWSKKATSWNPEEWRNYCNKTISQMSDRTTDVLISTCNKTISTVHK